MRKNSFNKRGIKTRKKFIVCAYSYKCVTTAHEKGQQFEKEQVEIQGREEKEGENDAIMI